jgi:hypothetical protein
VNVPIAEVKKVWRDTLAGLEDFDGLYGNVTVHAAWPGDDLLFANGIDSGAAWKGAVWFGPSLDPGYERHSMRADAQRRIVTCRIPVWIEVHVHGESNELGAAALLAEQIVYDLWHVIDRHVAEEKHLGSPELVTSAVVEPGSNGSAGFTDTGYGYRQMFDVEAKFRIL